MQVLCCLADSDGAVCTREHICATVWGHSHVTSDALSRLVAQLRKVFGAAPDAGVSLETLPRVGYRLLVAHDPPSRPDAEHEHSSSRSTRNLPLKVDT